MAVKHWVSWEEGVSLTAKTDPSLALPNLILHAASRIRTPLGASAAAMIFWQPDPSAPPLKFCFVSPEPKIASFLASEIFAGTPFQGAPAVKGNVSIQTAPRQASAHIEIPGALFHTSLSDLAPPILFNRPPEPSFPIHQQGLEATAGEVALHVNETPVGIFLPAVSITGGPCALFSPFGLYAR